VRSNCGRRLVLLAAGALFLGGCGSSQSTLSPHSGPAHDIDVLWWVMFVGSAIVFAVVTALVLVAALRRRGREDLRSNAPEPLFARRLVLWGGALVPLVVLVALFGLILHTIPSTSAATAREGKLTIRVVGRQWFWDVYYVGRHFSTANEIHIPVGVPVRLEVRTGDVIHSFWVPALNRKIDMIPGRENGILLEADRPGTYRGQCAEYCGLEHALMAFDVVAQRPAAFRRWLAAQQRPARGGGGARLFQREACAGCHRIRGTAAVGNVGPDLTHVGSRLTIAAGTLPNTRANVEAWIRDPQHVKPGNKMPAISLSDRDRAAVVAYLERLR
jgi:cytochrome c oxidase subunit II